MTDLFETTEPESGTELASPNERLVSKPLLFHGDCRKLAVSDVALIVTSPPYNCGKDYGTYNDNLPLDDYWRFTTSWLLSAYESLIPGGRLCVNLPWWTGKKPRVDVPGKFKELAMLVGFLFLDKIIWVKGDEKNTHTSGGFGGGGSGWGTYMSPSGPAIRCATEPILVFAKESRGRKVISGKGNGDCIKGDITKEDFLNWTIDAWFMRGASDKMHPAVFPDEIPRRLIQIYTYPGDTVFDPFMGSGTTGKMAKLLGRKFIGCEIDKEYFELATKRIEAC